MRILIPASILFFVGALVFSLFHGEDRAVGSGQEEVWARLIHERGPDKAYDIFADSIAEYSHVEKHEAAHFFGGVLYQTIGAAGVSTCDQRFSFGCFHELLGRAILEEGTEVVLSLNDACHSVLSQTPLSCQHGIGHGLMAHFGYDEAALIKALEMCRDIPYIDRIGGCYGGVFMEYNHRTMWGVSARPRESHKEYQFPCAVLDEAFTTACAFWQPQWWFSIMRLEESNVSADTVARRAGEYCTRSVDRDHCFQGIGNVMVFESRDENGALTPAIARSLCKSAARTDRDELHCLSIAANHFGLEESHSLGRLVCAELPPLSRAYCNQYAENRANVATRIPFPVL